MKTQLLTISTFAILLAAQSAMAFEQINPENGYEPALHNGWVVDASTDKGLDMLKASYVSQSSTIGFEQINSENGYDAAFRNGWVSPETSSASLDLMTASYRSEPADMIGQFEDTFSINYLSTH